MLTVVVKSGGIDVELGPSREVKYSRLASLIPNGKGGVLGGILWNYRYLVFFQVLLVAASGSTCPQHTGGNILKVSYRVLDGREFSHHNRRSDNASGCLRRDSFKPRNVIVGLAVGSNPVYRTITALHAYW